MTTTTPEWTLEEARKRFPKVDGEVLVRTLHILNSAVAAGLPPDRVVDLFTANGHRGATALIAALSRAIEAEGQVA